MTAVELKGTGENVKSKTLPKICQQRFPFNDQPCSFMFRKKMDFKSHLPHFDQNVIDSDNPWKASSIFEFQYFCCPECDCKSHTKQAFVDHASTYHTWVSYIIFL